MAGRICMIREPRGNTDPNIIAGRRDGSVTENGWMYVPLHREYSRVIAVQRPGIRESRLRVPNDP